MSSNAHWKGKLTARKLSALTPLIPNHPPSTQIPTFSYSSSETSSLRRS
jgi:hypothetical protein